MTNEQTVPASQVAQAVAPMAAPEIKKIVVAIHGIGDQYRNATIQSVVNIFGRCFSQTAAVPLGAFYSANGQINTFQLTGPPEFGPDLRQLGFVEAYWADIPRRVQQRGYTIEATKAWAQTVVDRVQSRYEQDLDTRLNLTRADYASAAAVLDEMIDAIGVLGNLTFLADKAGLFKFDLDELLTAFVGDVQVVADFANYRERICRHVWNILEAVHEKNEAAEIYLVAHSEGTVVMLFTLLKALCAGTQTSPAPPRPGWIEQVRGLMTIGSPIDKHIVLWMRMWDDVQTPDLSKPLTKPIAWRNYYDYADPVGFKLDTAREWLRDHKWTGFFEFEDKDDFGFARYFLPGKAHNDYWNDPLVFGHFIHDVLGLSPVLDGVKIDSPPPSRKWARFSSYFTPYFFIVLILAGAVYLIHSVVNGLIKQSEGMLTTIQHVLGLTCLLLGTTVASRIPCLTRKPSYKVLSGILFLVLAAGYLVLYGGWSWRLPSDIRRGDLLAIALAIVAVSFSIWSDRHKTFLQRWPPVRIFARGMRPLLIAGGLSAAILVIREIVRSGHSDVNLWPLILSGAAFIYLWWLAAILFDLCFTWQRYIRFAVWQRYLRRARKDRIVRERPFWQRRSTAK